MMADNSLPPQPAPPSPAMALLFTVGIVIAALLRLDRYGGNIGDSE